MSQKRLYKALIFFTILGVIISQTMFIPSWETQHMGLLFSVFALAAIVGIACMVRLWRWHYKYKGLSKPTGWFSPVFFSLIVIVGLPVVFFFSLLSSGQGFLGPSLAKEIPLGQERIYVYHNACFIPDSACECAYYYSLIYKKNAYLPIMHLVTTIDFYAGEVRLHKGELTILPSSTCSKDKGKIKKVRL
jgi:hypothetical protein